MSDNPIIVNDEKRKKRIFQKLKETMKRDVKEGENFTFWYVPADKDDLPQGADAAKTGGYFIVTIDPVDGKGASIGVDFAHLVDFTIQISNEFIKRHPEAYKKPQKLNEFGVV